MKNFSVDLVNLVDKPLYGLWKQSNDKRIFRDIPALSSHYYTTLHRPKDSVLPYFVLSKDYNAQTQNFALFIGSTAKHSGLQRFLRPGGIYAKITVRPKLGFLWGPAIGEAKRFFYTQWLPRSPYEALNMEYELHTQKSLGKHPTVVLFFAIGDAPNSEFEL